jgi:hypothetical protein
MTLREFLDSILAFIDAEALTDEEYASTQPMETEPGEYTVESYEKLKAVLTARESLSTTLTRLEQYYLAKGVEVTTPAKTPSTQIFIGSAL